MQFYETENIATRTLVDDKDRRYLVIEQSSDDTEVDNELIECVECGKLTGSGVVCVNTDDQFCLDCFKKKTILV